MSQLCVPKDRRPQILSLAHDSIFGGHLGERKTRDRIRLSFFWPRLQPDVHSYVMSCSECQLRSRKRMNNRVPITPITRRMFRFRL